MWLELTRLLLGLTIAAFHRPIADFMLQRERALVVLFRQRGVPLPEFRSAATARNLYFCLGIFVALLECLRIYVLLQ